MYDKDNYAVVDNKVDIKRDNLLVLLRFVHFKHQADDHCVTMTSSVSGMIDRIPP